MKKIVSLLAIAALVLVACNTKKPSAETVSAEAQKAAAALVQAVLKKFKIEDDEELDAIFNDAFDVALEDNGVDEEEIDALLKVRGIELVPLEKAAVEAAAETADKAEEIVENAAEQIAADAAEKAAEAVEEVVEEEEIPLILVQQKPGFEGGDDSAFLKWVNSQIVYSMQKLSALFLQLPPGLPVCRMASLLPSAMYSL